MSHQDVVEKLRLLNEEADLITLWVIREEVSQEGTSPIKVPLVESSARQPYLYCNLGIPT